MRERKFFAPTDVAELTSALKQKCENTFIVAGGTDLLIHFAKHSIFNYNLIDITKVDECRHIVETETEITIGAAVTMTELYTNEAVKKHLNALAQAAFNVGSQQIRNSATIGGNLSNASQSGDTIPVLFAFGAQVEIINSKGEIRQTMAEELVVGLEKTHLMADEAVVKIILPKSHFKSSFAKIGSRQTVTISKINCCLMLKTEDDVIKQAIAYFGAVGAKALKGNLVEQALVGRSIFAEMDEELKAAICEQIISFIPTRDSRFYKKEAAIGIVDNVLYDIRCQC